MMIKHWMKGICLLAALACCGLFAPASADPSLEGYTGLLLTPTTEILAPRSFNAGFFSFNLEEGADETVWTGNLGLTGNLEVGFARVKPDEAAGETILNAKLLIRPEENGRPALAVGVIDATDERDTTTYFVASTSLEGPLKVVGKLISGPKLYGGIAGGRMDGIFLGASAMFARRLTLIAEYDSRDANLGARLALTPQIRVHAGFIHGLDDFAVGASFNRSF